MNITHGVLPEPFATPRHTRRKPNQRKSIIDDHPIVFPDPIPFQHRKFRRMGLGALPISKHMTQRKNPLLPRSQ